MSHAAVEAAAQAFETWRFVPAPRRAEILFRAAEIMAARKEELSRDVTVEMGKVLKEARGDVQEGIDMTYYVAGEGRRMWGQTTPSELPNKFNMTVRQPHGIVAAITPWNFPDRHPVLEADARARHRQHRRSQAVAVFAAERLQPGPHSGRGRAAAGRREPRLRRRSDAVPRSWRSRA